MKNKIPCEVIKDLFPLYIDELTSEVTNKEINEHISECESCKKVLETMKEPDCKSNNDDEKEIDFLKKTNKRNKKIVAGSVIVTAILAVVILLVYRYVVGFSLKTNPDDWKVSVEGRHVQISGEPTDDKFVVKSFVVSEKDDVIHITYKYVYKKFDGQKSCELDYESGLKNIKEIWIGDDLVWQDGARISQMTMDVYNARHPYMGDASANVETTNMLKISEKIGGFTNELDSSGERLKWTIEFTDEVTGEVNNGIVKRCEAYGYVILATIDNLDEVVFRWNIKDSDDFITKTVKKEDMSNVKESGKTPSDLQKLMEELGIVK